MRAWTDFDELEPLTWMEWVPIGIIVALVFALVLAAGMVAR